MSNYFDIMHYVQLYMYFLFTKIKNSFIHSFKTPAIPKTQFETANLHIFFAVEPRSPNSRLSHTRARTRRLTLLVGLFSRCPQSWHTKIFRKRKIRTFGNLLLPHSLLSDTIENNNVSSSPAVVKPRAKWSRWHRRSKS